MSSITYKTALVTGASAGMGYAIATRLRELGLTVHAVGRNAEALEKIAAETGAIPHVVDVSDTSALEALVTGLEIDVLVNNAGVSRPGNLLSSSAFDIDEQIDVNLRAALQLSRLLLPGMCQRNTGHIFNITSIAGHYEFSGHTVYHATKAALHTVSRQLRNDAYGTDVRITEICPGRVETDIFARVEKVDSKTAYDKYFADYECPKPSDIADALAYAIGTPYYVNVSLIEILPTKQVPGGLRTGRKSEFAKTE